MLPWSRKIVGFAENTCSERDSKKSTVIQNGLRIHKFSSCMHSLLDITVNMMNTVEASCFDRRGLLEQTALGMPVKHDETDFIPYIHPHTSCPAYKMSCKQAGRLHP